jgi:hypothetical protein
MPTRTDVDYHFDTTKGGKDFIRVISEVYAPQGDRGLSVLGYQMRGGSPEERGLYRAVHGFTWEDAEFMGVNAQGAPPRLINLPPNLVYHDREYEKIARGIFRMEVAFQRKSDGKIIQDWNQLLATNLPSTSYGITNLASIVVAIAVVDESISQQISKEDWDQLTDTFAAKRQGQLAIQTWNRILNEEIKMKSLKVHPKLWSSISFFQRFYPIRD